MRFLIVDNERFLSENLSRYLLNKMEANVERVGTASEAIKALNKETFDLIISDLDLPDDMDGSWITTMAQKNPEQKLIIISADEIPQKLVENEEIQIAAYFEKPFDLDKLKTAILKLLEDHNSI
jgi:DNA-binding NtrC family response regulator